MSANHLENEKSPYLQQHVHNPVDWYPWGEEAFSLARKLEKPIFLSIGYATCHWCHVMEKESFENPEVAKLMNDTFVNIKVDREERPEVDSVYMEFAQALMGASGGWPLNVVLTPELKPFFAVTYLPPKTQRGLIGMDQFVTHIGQLWQSDERPFIIEQANKIVEIFSRAARTSGDEIPNEDHLSMAAEQLFELADPVYGGMKGEPKFPMAYQSQFLMAYGKVKNENRALFFVELTLDMMAKGGIYDHLGGGFSRYCVDERWFIPHFEKMLYDNALLARAYLEGWKLFKKESYATVCKETLDYILRDMTHAQGGFYSAEDADTEGKEGFFYTWTKKEIQETLPPGQAEAFCNYFHVIEKGNFEGRNILSIDLNTPEPPNLKEAKQLLFKKREERPHPFKDDKIITGWNGLMIDAMAQAGAALRDDRYTQAAVKAAEFIRANLWKDGKLLRRFRDGEAKFSGTLDDYAYLMKGILSLYEVGLGPQWLDWAKELYKVLEMEFKASPKGAFYQTDGKGEIIIRKCDFYDGSEPSGNAVMAENLIRLYQITNEDQYRLQAENILKAAKNFIETFAPGACYHLIALLRYLDKKALNCVIELDKMESLKKEISSLIFTTFSPHTAVSWKEAAETTLALCRQNVCQPPLVGKDQILKALEGAL